MRQLTYYVASSIDGRIAGADGDFSMFDATGDHMQIVTGRYRDALPTAALKALGLAADRSVFDTVIMGRNTYAVGRLVGVDNPYSHLRQYVASSRPADTPPGITVTSEPAQTVRALRMEAGGSGIWLCGGGRLAATLAAQIDRLVVKVNPVIIGDAGVPLFGAAGPPELVLMASERFESGVVINEYVRPGAQPGAYGPTRT